MYGEVEVPEPDAAGGWRSAAVRCAHSLRETFLRHPWIVSVLGESGVAYLGPNLMRMSEDLLGVFEAAGFDLEASDRAMNTMIAYVIGVATVEAAWLTKVARSGRSEDEWLRHLLPAAGQAVQGYPRLRRLYESQLSDGAGAGREDTFKLGLDCVLDGLEARLGSTARLDSTDGGPTRP